MTDELVKWLRGWDHCWPAPGLERAVAKAADRIVTLAAERDEYESAWLTAEGKLADVEAERDAALAEVEQWRLSHGHLDQLAVDLSVRLISVDVWPEPMQEGEDGTEADYIACCANILEAVDRLTAERDRLKALVVSQGAQMQRQSEAAEATVTRMAAIARAALKGETP